MKYMSAIERRLMKRWKLYVNSCSTIANRGADISDHLNFCAPDVRTTAYFDHLRLGIFRDGPVRL